MRFRIVTKKPKILWEYSNGTVAEYYSGEELSGRTEGSRLLAARIVGEVVPCSEVANCSEGVKSW